MANKIITFVIDTLEPELDSVLAAAINELHNLGHKVKEVRVSGDTGEANVAINTVEGVTVHEPVPQVSVPAPVAQPVSTEPDGDEPPATESQVHTTETTASTTEPEPETNEPLPDADPDAPPEDVPPSNPILPTSGTPVTA